MLALAVFITSSSNLQNRPKFQFRQLVLGCIQTNLTTKRDTSILPTMPSPQQQQTQGPVPSNPLVPQQRAVAPNQKRTPIKVDKKIGRNDKVEIQKGSESKIIKFKKADSYLNDT